MYPTKEQKVLIDKHIESCRFIYNKLLELKIKKYTRDNTNMSAFDLMKVIPIIKKNNAWLKETNSQSLQNSAVEVDKAFKSFFKKITGFPRFKPKTIGGSFISYQNTYVDLRKSKLILPKFKSGINIKIHRSYCGDIKVIHVIKTSTCKYFTSIVVDDGIISIDKNNISFENTIGIDLGLDWFLSTSDGDKYKNPKERILYESKRKYLKNKFEKYGGARTKKRLLLIHEKQKNKRDDFLQKTSATIINNNKNIAIEDLDIKNMLKDLRYYKGIIGSSWGSFLIMLDYKSKYKGNNILKINKYDPSSKICSKCGNINEYLKISDRHWICSECDAVHDRDINAAINIKNIALNRTLSKELGFKNRN